MEGSPTRGWRAARSRLWSLQERGNGIFDTEFDGFKNVLAIITTDHRVWTSCRKRGAYVDWVSRESELSERVIVILYAQICSGSPDGTAER